MFQTSRAFNNLTSLASPRNSEFGQNYAEDFIDYDNARMFDKFSKNS